VWRGRFAPAESRGAAKAAAHGASRGSPPVGKKTGSPKGRNRPTAVSKAASVSMENVIVPLVPSHLGNLRRLDQLYPDVTCRPHPHQRLGTPGRTIPLCPIDRRECKPRTPNFSGKIPPSKPLRRSLPSNSSLTSAPLGSSATNQNRGSAARKLSPISGGQVPSNMKGLLTLPGRRPQDRERRPGFMVQNRRRHRCDTTCTASPAASNSHEQ